MIRNDLPADTVHLVRILPNGDLDPTFNNSLVFLRDGIPGPPGFGASVSRLLPLADGRLLVMGPFTTVNGEPRRGLCVVDAAGQLESDFANNGVGYFWDQLGNQNELSVRGAAPTPDPNTFYIWGPYHGYQDDVVNDTAQRFVSRLIYDDLTTVAGHAPAEPQATLLLQPNPASTWVAFTYSMGARGSAGQVVVRDLMGRPIHRATASHAQGQLVWDVRGVAPGSYTVQLVRDGGVLRTEKLVLH